MRRTRVGVALAALVLGSVVVTAAPKRPKRYNLPDEPVDLRVTKAHESGMAWDQVHHDWNLGPTGARGWMWIRRSKEDTGTSRQILISEVAKGSPADGVLQRGDIILGIDGKPFAADARVTFGKAIGAAETEAGKGVLRLMRWRPDGGAMGKVGKIENVTVTIEVMGAWAYTAPYNCLKTKRIIEKACAYLRKRTADELGRGLTGPATGLGMLATGRKEFGPVVKAAARAMAPNPPDQVKSLCTWYYGMNTLFLMEYYLATGDETVRPGIRRHLLDIAEGQARIGTWGHRFAIRELDILPGYGALNAAGLPCSMALAMAPKLGIDGPVVKRATQRSVNFFGNYAGRGGIPYGAHKPYSSDNNGKSAQAAVFFDLAGRAKEAAWFAKLSAGSIHQRETGHTGNWLSFLWGPLGVGRGGEEALIAHFRELRWYWDLERRWDGSILYQGRPTGRDGKNDAKAHKYYNWDCTGARLLMYCYPMRKIHLTGKVPSVVKPMTRAEAIAAVGSGIDDIDTRSLAALRAGCQSWNPWERQKCAAALAAHGAEHMPGLIAQLGKGPHIQRAAAAGALGAYGPGAEKAIDALVAELAEPNVELRLGAMAALRAIGPAARPKALPAVLKLAGSKIDNDPLNLTKRGIFAALFGPIRRDYGMAKENFDGVDRTLVIQGLKGLLEDSDNAFDMRQIGVAYGHIKGWDLKTLKPLLPAVVDSIAKRTSAGQMDSGQLPVDGLALLGELGVSDGMGAVVARICQPQTVWLLEYGLLQKMAEHYGVATQAYLPKLRAFASKVASVNKPHRAAAAKTALEAGIAAIEKTTAKKELTSIKEL